ncbi:MAG TPA: hypothetical protein VMY35_13590 [Phycisphaerae bacterium]|nr:hypothetical protein [Phycisphaerae bacterium]
MPTRKPTSPSAQAAQPGAEGLESRPTKDLPRIPKLRGKPNQVVQPKGGVMGPAGPSPNPAKPPPIKIAACMSVPRLGFMDNFFTTFQALLPLGIPIHKGTGAFWGQCLERVMLEGIKKNNPDAILTIDYDTIFKAEDVGRLAYMLSAHPEIDAIAAVQSHRYEPLPLMTIRDKDYRPMREVPYDYFFTDLSRVSTAHFGLTLIRVSSLLKMRHPWFKAEPAPDGSWSDGRIDDDIYFWNKWGECGHAVYLANRVVIGHMELMIRWPGRQFRVIYQHPNDYFKTGPPIEAWQ